MPPQVNPSGCRPIHLQASAGAEELKSCETEKKAPEEHKESSTSTTDQHRATQKEVSNRKAELSTQAVAQQAALNGKLEQKAAKSENGAAPAKTIEDAVLRLESVSKETQRLLEQHKRAQQQRADNALNLLESVSKETQRLLELEKAKIRVNVKTSREVREQ